MEEYRIPSQDAEAEFVEKHSRFITHIWHTQTEEEALARLKWARETYWDATHNVYAYLLRGNICLLYTSVRRMAEVMAAQTISVPASP